MPPTKHKLEWIQERVGHAGDDCLQWPFSRSSSGYGILFHEGKVVYAHRTMCELANGKPPTPKHHASHSCGRGHLGCVNPRHLEWKTAAENQQDRRKHGTWSRYG